MSTFLSACILVIYSIILTVNGQLTEEEIVTCRQQTSYSSVGLNSVDVALYYDVDQEALDFTFVKAMCTAYNTISHATFTFYPGVSTKMNDAGELECYHKDKSNKDCTDSYAAACASQLVDDFTAWVCCTADGGSACDCLNEQNPELKDQFDQCTQLQDPTINPGDILLNNSDLAAQVDPAFVCFPIMSFNGDNDPCARFMFAEAPIDVVCSMLAENTDDACNQQN